MKAGILDFPGINCGVDLMRVLTEHFHFQVEVLDYRESFDAQSDVYFVPGGFSYGDYLRSGALAARSRSIESLRAAAGKGVPVIGICNGFQILTEGRLLPGALVKNATLKHICRWVDLKGDGQWKNALPDDWALPVSHSEGNYLCDDETYDKMVQNGQILLRYKNDENGSRDFVACIADANHKIIGLMPHPERAIEKVLDHPLGDRAPGKKFFELAFQMIF